MVKNRVSNFSSGHACKGKVAGKITDFSHK